MKKFSILLVLLFGLSIAPAITFAADCPDKVCMNPSHIEKPGQSLVCLPHKVMIEIKGMAEDDVILSY